MDIDLKNRLDKMTKKELIELIGNFIPFMDYKKYSTLKLSREGKGLTFPIDTMKHFFDRPSKHEELKKAGDNKK